jgi:hypothetical protein
MTSDLDGIKAALKYLIERDQSRDISLSHCSHVNNHLYKPEDEQAAKESIIKFYKPILDGLK